LEQAKIANGFAAFISKLEMRVDIRLAPITSKRTIDIFVVNFRYWI
jgi:hypothetical protein